MAIEVKLPRQSEDNDESLITFWHASEGDYIEKGQTLVEVQTAKAVSEIEAPESSYIKEIKKQRGDTVKVDEVLVVLDTNSSGESDAELETATTVEVVENSQEVETVVEVRATPRVKRLAKQLGVDWQKVTPTSPAGKLSLDDIREAAEALNQPVAEETIEKVVSQPTEKVEKKVRTVIAAPSVRKYARENNINLEEIEALSPNGRVTKIDVDRALQANVEVSKSPSTVDEVIPFSGIRKVIANAMVHSKTTIPHVTHFDEAEVSRLVDHRQKTKAYFSEEDVKLTYLAYIVKALTKVLKKYPMLNASLDDQNDKIILHKQYNMGIAVDTERGLVVPVIKNADQKSLFDIAKEIQELSKKAREGSIKADEMSGGTCTISNIGSERGAWFTPIINAPQSCILGFGRIEKKVVVIDDAIEIRPVMALSLSYDHRLIDGATAQKAVNEFKKLVHEPDLLLAY
ncbi:2-oxo acid dehydrogenase subunit E2 [Bacillus sp. HNG]|uniref:2-oxo acid dehydrogenase subunit E2 n=1 Tax=Bacillus sp. HNG TaxID=2293325 RepID=UPI000E2F116B|nr:2-oxo acid dehydrogenase subunit E2 [Bacillus sp. HNG]RFB15211.1 2-oxo acid dehydrogenase subunit E2 [Bacillus sp. HNG]